MCVPDTVMAASIHWHLYNNNSYPKDYRISCHKNEAMLPRGYDVQIRINLVKTTGDTNLGACYI